MAAKVPRHAEQGGHARQGRGAAVHPRLLGAGLGRGVLRAAAAGGAAAAVRRGSRQEKQERETYTPMIIHPPLSNKKASNKKLDSQISHFSRKSKDLIRESNENSLLKDKKSRLSLEKSYFLLDRGGESPPRIR